MKVPDSEDLANHVVPESCVAVREERCEALTPISGLMSSEQTTSAAAGAAGFQFQCPYAMAERTRFFVSWLRRIAPDTHEDQANGAQQLPIALVALPPQKNVGAATRPLGSHRTDGCRTRHHSTAGSRCRRSALLHIGDGGTASYSEAKGWLPVNARGLPVAVVTFTRSSVSHQTSSLL